MKYIKKLLQKKVFLQGSILCRYGRCILDLVDEAVAKGNVLDVVSDLGASSMELLKEYQSVCNELSAVENNGERILYHFVSFPGKCEGCGANLTLDEAVLGREPIKDGYQLYYTCPHCNERIQDIILCEAV